MTKRRCIGLAAQVVAIALIAASAVADTSGWSSISDGRFPSATPPTEWGEDTNVVWKAELPGSSNASPLLIEKKSRLLVLNEPDQILAVDSTDGSIAWSASVADIADNRPGAHKANGWTSATPVTDGERVFAVFGNGVVAAYTLEGNRLWARLVQPPKHRWGHSASPVLVEGRLVVHMVDLFGLDPDTGRELWKQTSEVTWGSPVSVRIQDTDVIVTSSGDVFASSDGRRIAARHRLGREVLHAGRHRRHDLFHRETSHGGPHPRSAGRALRTDLAIPHQGVTTLRVAADS